MLITFLPQQKNSFQSPAINCDRMWKFLLAYFQSINHALVKCHGFFFSMDLVKDRCSQCSSDRFIGSIVFRFSVRGKLPNILAGFHLDRSQQKGCIINFALKFERLDQGK